MSEMNNMVEMLGKTGPLAWLLDMDVKMNMMRRAG